MKEFFSNIGIEVTLTVLGLAATALGWIVGKASTYRTKIVEQTLNDVEVDVKQDSNITRMDARIATLEGIIERLQTEVQNLKGENDQLEQKLFRNLERVESKIDKVYELILREHNG